MRHLRGSTISMVFQDALSGLNPAFTIGTQLMDVITAHRRVGRAEARTIAVEALEHGRHRANPSSGCASIRTSSPAACASAC